MSVMSSVARGSPLRPSRSCSGTPASRARASRIAASTPARATRPSGGAAIDGRPDVAVRDDRAAQPGRGRGDLGQQLGLILARDRRQRGRLAEPGRAPRRPCPPASRAPAPRAWCRSARSRSRTARAAESTAVRRRSRRSRSGRAWARRQCNNSNRMSDARKLLFTRGDSRPGRRRGQRRAGDLPDRARVQRVRGRRARHRHAARVGGGHAGGRPARLPAVAPAHLAGRGGADGADGIGLRRAHGLLAADDRRRRRHAEPVVRRRQRVSSDRAGRARAHRRRPGPDDGLRLVQPGRLAGGRGGRAGERRARRGRVPPGRGAAARRARRVRLLRRLRRARGGRLHAAVTGAGDPSRASAPGAPLAESRAIVLRLAALFSIDSFGGGFVVQSLLVLWLHRRFDLDARTTAGVFFVAGALARVLAGPLAVGRRAHRPDPDDGLHAPAREPVPDPGGRSCRRRRWRSRSCCCAWRCRRWTSRPARPS